MKAGLQNEAPGSALRNRSYWTIIVTVVAWLILPEPAVMVPV
jgi:hypothetical protein